MKHVLMVFFFYLFQLMALAQNANVLQLEHTLRWLSDYNFPNFLEDATFEASLREEVIDRLAQYLPDTEINCPDHFDYRIISYFGKTKVKMPKASSQDYQVAIASSLTRETVGYAVVWNMKVVIQKAKRVIIDREAEHQLEPYSISIRFSNRPWMDQEEFENIFILLLEECLGLRDPDTTPISLGSPEMVRKNIDATMPIFREYPLAIWGAMMEESASRCKILHDSVVVGEFSYKPTRLLVPDFSVSGREIFAGLFTQITGIGMQYTLQSKEHRTGIITAHNGSERKIRLDWLEENIQYTNDDLVKSRIISPITGQYFIQDSMVARFIFFEEIRPMEDMTLHNMHFQMDGDMAESVSSMVGEFNGIKFSLLYREFEELIFIKIDDQLKAILSLINMNPDSQTFGKTKLSKNKKFLVPATRAGKRGEVDPSSSENYMLYTTKGVEDDAVIEMGYFLLLLFFAIGSTG